MGTLLKTFKKIQIDNFIKSVNTSNYYVFTAKISAWPDDNNPPAPFESYQDAVFDNQNQMFFGKKLTPSNVQYLAKRVNWASNTAYAQFDVEDINLFSKDFFVITSDNNVYKCLYNNNGIPSTVKPNLTQNSTFTTSDGYVWKYLYSVSGSDMNNFGSNYYIPITPNTQIQSSASDGVEILEIVAGGQGYITSTNGLVQSVVSNNTVIQLDNSASYDNHFYDNCAFYVPATGALRTVASYSVNSTGKWVTLDNSINGIVPSQTTYEINPRLLINGDGTGAQGITRTSNGVLTSAILLSPGTGYSRANVAVIANTSYGSSANVAAFVGPPGGHGSDVYSELCCDTFGVFMSFSNNDSLPVISQCDYRSVGLLASPTYPGNNAPYTANVFNQILVCNTTPSVIFTQGNYVVGNTTNAKAFVASSNSTALVLVGDKNFSNNDVLFEYYTSDVYTGKSGKINTITSVGDIDQTSPSILYYTNISPIERSNTTSEIIKLSIKL